MGIRFGMRGVTTTASGTTGNQTITFSDLDIPSADMRAVIVWYGAGTVLGTAVANKREHFGMSDGTTTLAFMHRCRDARNTGGDCDLRIHDGSIVYSMNNNNTNVNHQASFVQWEDSGMTINWSTAAASTLNMHFVFFFGDQMECQVDEVALNATQDSTVSVTGMSNEPDVLIGFWPDNDFPTTAALVTGRSHLSIGFCENDGSESQNCMAMFETDADPTRVGGMVRNDMFCQRLTDDAVSCRGEVTAFNSDGYTITTRNASASMTGMVLAVHLAGRNHWVGQPDINTDTTGGKPITIPGFRPQGLFFLGSGINIVDGNSHVTSSNLAGQYSFGFADQTGFEGGLSTQTQDAANTSSTDTVTHATTCRVLNASAGDLYSVSLTSFDEEGFTLNVDTAAGADKLTLMMAIEEEADPNFYLEKHPNIHLRR